MKHQAVANVKVINAFRHQRFLHPMPSFPSASTPGDQRLSASKIFALDRALGWREVVAGDQRLSASKIFARLPSRRGVKGGLVINAFRHQRFLHGGTAARPDLARRVINAFRHQRFLHPFSLTNPQSRRRVINAFRHQRFLHTCSHLNNLHGRV